MTRRVWAAALLALLTTARAAEPVDDASEAPAPAPTTPAEAPVDPASPRWRWSGIGIPTVKYNTTDKLGFGAGVELYEKPAGGAFGYRHRLSISTFWTTSGNYGSNWVQLERRGRAWWVARLTYALWRNMVYVGAGGAAVSVRNGEEAFGNTVAGPSALFTGVLPLRRSPVQLWVQGYLRQATVRARAGGPLDQLRPFGVDGGVYFDVSTGLALTEVDRWPVPNKGLRGEASLRWGGTFAPRGFQPLVGVNAELIAYTPLVGRHLVLGVRGLIDKTWGERPFFEQENLGGQLRDEVAYEQMLTGYSRSRTRGDGVAAAMVELRPYFGATGHPTIDIGFYLSAFAEGGWLFQGDDPGPFMPSVGAAPLLVWQEAVELRPFVAWGWLSEVPNGPRRPTPQVGVSLLAPL